MSNPRLRVLIASPLEAEHAARIEAAAPEVQLLYAPELLPVPRYPADHDGTPRRLGEQEIGRWREMLAEADVLFDFDWLDPSALPRTAPRVRWVQATSSGIGEFLERTGLIHSSITFTTAAGVHAVPLAEFVVLGLLYLAKDVPQLRSRQHEHHWERFTNRRLAGQRIVLVGLGAVGREVARACAALGLEVWAMPRTRPDQLPDGVRRIVDRGELADALATADALVLACPYTPETHHLIQTAQFAALKRGAMLINIARGPVVDEGALVEALRRGQVGGAVLDVFEREPLPADSPLWDMPNVLVSPHSASTVHEESELIVDLFIDNLRRFISGAPLRNVFDARRGY